MTITGVKTQDFTPSQDEQGDLHYGHGEAGTHAPGMSQRRMLEVEIDVLEKNNHLAARNRARFAAQKQLVLNLVSSPGSGKTTLLTETLQRLKNQVPCAVIEGDQQTVNDAARIRATGTPAIQVNTGKGCHLDAQMIADAAPRLPLESGGILFIENVGNLVCPASFDLGERHKVAVLSVTEGEDKPLKYPHMFAAASLMLLNKIDLLPYLNFDVEKCLAYAREVNPQIEILLISATSGEGMAEWLDWLETQRCA
ncbi:hydrogenase accessory protein HypB [Yokenella regensburgei ATCC 43003]|nr:hydrogenase accessory protein HypB [Yokenella regensburgei ATCC 43003]